MKNIKVQIIAALLLIATLLTGCNDSGATPTQPPHEHAWVDANCTDPKTCTSCGAKEGEALGHDFAEATYYVPKTCKTCGFVDGDVLESPLPDKYNLALQIDKLPVATPDMTEDELRDVILKFMYLQLNFAFTPVFSTVDSYGYYIKNLYSAYNGSQSLDNLIIKYEEGKYYGGIPYMGNSAGSLYRWLEFYDPVTGAMDWDPLLRTRRKNWSDSGRVYPDVGSAIFGNTCASSCIWAYLRVTNKIETFWTNTWIPENGFVKVGDYNLSADEDHGGSTKSLCSKNGKKKMFAAYAKIKKADGLVTTGHAVMSLTDAVVVYGADGNIDENNSYIQIAEQKASFLTASPAKGGVDLYSPLGDKGLTYRIMGNHAGNIVNGKVKEMKWTFKYLYENGYMPFTIPELCGQDKVEKSEVGLYKANVLYTEDTIKASELRNMNVKSNYAISDIHFIIRDENGNEIFNAMYAELGNDVAALKSFSVNSALFNNTIYENNGIINVNIWNNATSGKNTLEITARLSTGELISVFNGTLTE